MKKNILLFSLLFSFFVNAQNYDTHIQQEASPFYLPTNTNSHGIMRFSEMPEFALPSQFKVLSTGGPSRAIMSNIWTGNISFEDIRVFNERQDQIKHGWTHTDYLGFSYNDVGQQQFIPYGTVNIPESNRVYSLYMDHILNNIWDLTNRPHRDIFNVDFNLLSNELNNIAGGYNANFAEYNSTIIHADYVWINLETVSADYPASWYGGSSNDWWNQFMYSFYPQLIQTVRQHLRPSTKLFVYGINGAIETPTAPNYSFAMDFDGRTYNQIVTNTTGDPVSNPSYGLVNTPFQWTFTWNDINYQCSAPYPPTASCIWPSDPNPLCDTISEALYGNISMCLPAIELAQDRDVYRISGPYNQDDYINGYLARKPLMYMSSLYYYPSQSGPRTFNPVKTLSTEDAKAAAIFPFMMGQKEICIWIDPMQNGWPAGIDPSGNLFGGTSGYSLQMMDDMLRKPTASVYEDFTNGLFMLSQFSDMFDGTEIYINDGKKVFDWASECKCASTNNTWSVLCPIRYPNAEIRPFWRGVIHGDYLLVAVQNPFQNIGSSSSFQVSLSLPNGDNYTTDPFTLTGTTPRLLKYCIKPNGCDLGTENNVLLLGSHINKTNLIQWNIEPEGYKYIASFVVEKVKKQNFEPIDTIFATPSTSNYEMIDAGINEENLSTYRLKIIQKDGTHSYSNIVQIITKVSRKVLVTPNPTTQKELNMSIPLKDTDIIKLEIYNSLGQIFIPSFSHSPEGIKVNIESFAPGYYQYNLVINDTILQDCIIIVAD